MATICSTFLSDSYSFATDCYQNTLPGRWTTSKRIGMTGSAGGVPAVSAGALGCRIGQQGRGLVAVGRPGADGVKIAEPFRGMVVKLANFW